jgi:hypothetical protein
MLIIWSGAGAVALILPIVVCLVTNIVTSKIFDESNYFQRHLWPKLAALGITGVCCFFLGRYLHSQPARIVLDKNTGQEIVEKPYHHFMFIKLEYWGLIFVAIGLVLLLFNLAS